MNAGARSYSFRDIESTTTILRDASKGRVNTIGFSGFQTGF
jgi:hypothetical protein